MRHPNRTILAAAIAACALLTPAVGAAALDGGQEGVDAQNSGQSDTAGPERPGVRWLSEIMEGRSQPRQLALSLDSEGHVLVQGSFVDDVEGTIEVLIAVNRDDGTIAWEAEGVDRNCDVAASDDGFIYGMAQAGSEATSYIAIDAATGVIDDTRTYTAPDDAVEPRVRICADGLTLLDDGTLLGVEPDKRIRAIDTTTVPMSQSWVTQRASFEQLGRVPVSPDQSVAYLLWTDRFEPREVHLEAIDIADGSVIDDTVVPGDRLPLGAQGDAFLVDDDGGILVNSESREDGPRESHVTRVEPDMSVDWTLTVGADQPPFDDASGFGSMVQAGPDQVVGWYSGTQIIALDLADGSVNWVVDPSSFTNNESRIVADADGNTYWGAFGGDWIQSVDVDGRPRWSFPNCAIGEPTEVNAIGPIDEDGVLYSVNRTVEPAGLRVTALVDDEPLPQGTCPEDDERLSGDDRFETGVEISKDVFATDGTADVVILARSDNFADALSGAPLAVQENGPLLITPPDRLVPSVAAEITRLLGADTSKTVYLLGGPVALSPAIEQAVRDLGYRVERVAGESRIDTAIEVAERLDQIDNFLITTGYNFPDALAAGVAAANVNGAVMLTFTGERAPATDAFMDANPDATRYAIGGPAAGPYTEATPLVGQSRTETAVLVAETFFDDPVVAGLARQDNFPDSLTGGAHIALGVPELGRQGGPMLLTASDQLLDAPANHLCDNEASLQRIFLYGGESAISTSVAAAAADRIAGTGC